MVGGEEAEPTLGWPVGQAIALEVRLGEKQGAAEVFQADEWS